MEKIIEKRKETPSFLTFYIRIGGGLSLQLGEYIRSDMPDKKVLVVTIGLGTLLLLPILRRWTRQNSTQRHEGLPTSNTSCKKSGVPPTPVKKRERVRFADERVLTDSVKGSSPLEEFIPDYSEVEREDSIPVISQDLRLLDSLPNNSGSNNSTRFINRDRSFSCYFFC